jgi:hypothetical protein
VLLDPATDCFSKDGLKVAPALVAEERTEQLEVGLGGRIQRHAQGPL